MVAWPVCPERDNAQPKFNPIRRVTLGEAGLPGRTVRGELEHLIVVGEFGSDLEERGQRRWTLHTSLIGSPSTTASRTTGGPHMGRSRHVPGVGRAQDVNVFG
jgi:hypothetical protein